MICNEEALKAMSKAADHKPGHHPNPNANSQAHSHGASSAPAKSVADSCASKGCRAPVLRFGFCAEHYDHFKFGLVRRDGTPASDYEKKFDHYLAHQKASKNRKVA